MIFSCVVRNSWLKQFSFMQVRTWFDSWAFRSGMQHAKWNYNFRILWNNANRISNNVILIITDLKTISISILIVKYFLPMFIYWNDECMLKNGLIYYISYDYDVVTTSTKHEYLQLNEAIASHKYFIVLSWKEKCLQNCFKSVNR